MKVIVVGVDGVSYKVVGRWLFVRFLSETHLNLFQRLVLGFWHFFEHVQHEQTEQYDKNEEHVCAQNFLYLKFKKNKQTTTNN